MRELSGKNMLIFLIHLTPSTGKVTKKLFKNQGVNKAD